MISGAMTGNLRVRPGILGRLVLQVELKPRGDDDTPRHFRYWRDARAEDLNELGPLTCPLGKG